MHFRPGAFGLWARLPTLAALILLGAGAGCGVDEDDGAAVGAFVGRIEVDGSSTLGPFTALAAEHFQRENPAVSVTVGVTPSRTGGGFERFCAGETDLSNASRPIDEEERQACRQEGVEYIEFQVANDALTVVVNPENDWAECLTVGELKKIWEPGSRLENWSQVRSGFSDEDFELFGAGTESGTFDYFTGEIVGEEGATRSDYVASEDDNLTVEGVARTRGGLGYLGLAYFKENEDRLKAIEIDSGSGCVAPSVETAQSGDYAPLSRPLFLYATKESFQKPHVRAFVEYALANAVSFAEGASLVPLTPKQLEREQAKFAEAAQDVGG